MSISLFLHMHAYSKVKFIVQSKGTLVRKGSTLKLYASTIRKLKLCNVPLNFSANLILEHVDIKIKTLK